MKFKIEKANISDSLEILELQKLAYQVEAELYNNYDIPPLKQTLAELKSQFQDHVILKAISDNKIIGTVRAYQKNDVCYIGRLAVDPKMQNQGVGTALMHEIESKYNPHKYELFTGYKSKKNIQLYKKLDYKILKIDTKECGTTELIYMEKINRK